MTRRSMRAWVAGAVAALQGFFRGFLGIAAAAPHDARGAREHLCRKGEGRTPCC
jgi:hypothetical protein